MEKNNALVNDLLYTQVIAIFIFKDVIKPIIMSN